MQIKFNDFYETHDHVVTFLGKFKKEFPNVKKLSFSEKFELYLAKYPDYDCWAKAIYYSYDPQDIMKKVFFCIDNVYISAKGNLAKFTDPRREIFTDGKELCFDQTNYYVFGVKKSYFKLHRCVASTFLKRPKNLKDIPFHKLQVNHKDGNKKNSCSSNLEWCTSKQNVNHALWNGLRSFKTYVLILTRDIHPYKKGDKFYFKNKDLKDHGFDSTQLVKSSRAYKSLWEIIKNDDVKKFYGLPNDLTKEMITKK